MGGCCQSYQVSCILVKVTTKDIKASHHSCNKTHTRRRIAIFPPSNHAAVSPSRLSRIVDCPGSFRLAQQYESKQSSYAAEGTHLHHATELTIKKAYPDKYIQAIVPMEVDPNIVNPPLDAEQRDTVQDCVDYLHTLMRSLEGPSLAIEIEARVDLKEFDPVLYECAGTCDIILKTDAELHAIDWKFGRGIPVYAENNDQCYAYATGAASNFDSLETFETINIHVIQPRLESFDVHVSTPEELIGWLGSRIIPGVTRAYEKHAPFNPSTSSCRWCPAKIGCRARLNFTNQVAADVFKMHAALPGDEVSEEELAKVLSKAAMYEGYIKDLRLHVQRTIEAGKEFIGYKMVRGRSIRRWIDTYSAEEALSHEFDIDQLYTSKFISPAQAEKLKRGMKKEEWFLDLVEKPEGKATLVKESDKRAPIEYKTTSQIFKQLED